MTATFNERRTLRRLVEEQKPKIGMDVRIRIFHLLPSFPWITFNPNALERGKIISENKYGDAMKYTVRFQNGDQIYWDYYPEDAVDILPEIK